MGARNSNTKDIFEASSGRAEAGLDVHNKTGAVTRNDKGGIDWMRYREEALKPLFFPFLTDLESRRSGYGWLAQEDNAPAHASRWNRQLWMDQGFQILEWPVNSPDLSAIEPPWARLKLSCRAHSTISKKKLEDLWREKWKEYPQKKR